jgi:hypothetical protein
MPLDNKSHWNEVELEQYSMGKLPQAEVEALEEHLLVCPLCRDHLSQADDFTTSMRRVSARLRAEDEAQSRARLPPWLAGPRMAWALAGIVLVAASLVVYLRRSPAIQGPPAVVYLEALRGAPDAGRVPPGRPFVAKLDVRGLPPAAQWPVEVVDSGGRLIWRGSLNAAGGTAEGRIDTPLHPGQYFVRLQSPSRELLREFSLTAR